MICSIETQQYLIVPQETIVCWNWDIKNIKKYKNIKCKNIKINQKWKQTEIWINFSHQILHVCPKN